MRFLKAVFLFAFASHLSVGPHSATRVPEGEDHEFLIMNTRSLSESPQRKGLVPPSTPNPCGKTPISGPPCKSPSAPPARAHATTAVVKGHFGSTTVPEGESHEYLIKNTRSLSEIPQQKGLVPPSTPNPCGKTPVRGPPCKSPPASPATANATTAVVKGTVHK